MFEILKYLIASILDNILMLLVLASPVVTGGFWYTDKTPLYWTIL